MNYWTAIPRSNWPGLKVSACMCLRYNYALPLIPAAPHVTSGLEVNIQGVLWMDTMEGHSKARGAERCRRRTFSQI